VDFLSWLRRQVPGGLLSNNAGGLLGGISQPPDPNRGQGMMAGVPGFDPSDPGAYANRTAGNADMGGYGGSPRLPDQPQFNYGALTSAGMQLIAIGEAPPPSGPIWQPMVGHVQRPAPIDAGAMLAQIFPATAEADLYLEMLRRQRRPMGLLG